MKHFWALDKRMALLSAHGPLPWVAILLNVAKMCTESTKWHLYNLIFFENVHNEYNVAIDTLIFQTL